MNPFLNIWRHPRTSIVGMLIAVVSVAGVLSQQGITLGTVGTGSVVTLVSALATALLGLLARDPGGNAPSGSAGSGMAKLGAWMLIAILVGGTMPVLGCSRQNVAQNIVSWTPPLESAVATADSMAAVLDPADAAVFTAATSGLDAAAKLLTTQARAYLANPSASTLAQLQAQVVALEQQVNNALLQTARITNANSQQHVLTAVQAVATIVMAMLTLVQSVSSKSAVAQMAAQSQVKLAAVAPYMDHSTAVRVVAAHYGEPAWLAGAQVAQAEQEAVRAGF